MSAVVRVKREGGRGHHLIAADKYDPKVHELVSDGVANEPDLSDPLNIPSASEEAVAEAAKPAPSPESEPAPAPAKRPRRKARK